MNKTEKILRAVIYIRVSTEEQARHGYSLDSQKKRLIEYCKIKNYKLVDIYADEGKTARTKLNNRKELLRLVDDANKDKYDIIVFWRLDRWFRNVADYYKVQEILEKNKIEWECSDEEYNTNTSNGRLHLNIKLSIAQNESDQTADRIKFNFERMVKDGYVTVGKQGMPLGYTISNDKKNKKMIKDPDTEQIATDMWENIQITGSIRKTLIYINNKYNLNICYDSMRHYLMNEKYYGSYKGNNTYCPPYVTKEEFDKVQSLIKRNVKMNKRHDYIFSGLLNCPICHRKLSGFTSISINKNNKRYKYSCYRCNYHYAYKSCAYNKKPVETTVEKYLIENIKNEINKYIVSTESIMKKEDNNKIDTTKLSKKIDRLNDLYIEGRISKEKYETDYNIVSNQIKQYTPIIKKENNNKLKKIIENDNIMELYQKLSNENKRNFWADFIDYIEITLDNEYIINFKK